MGKRQYKQRILALKTRKRIFFFINALQILTNTILLCAPFEKPPYSTQEKQRHHRTGECLGGM
jgi:hypothetical protein